MKAYLDIVKNVLENGTEKLPERKLEDGRKLDNSTIGLPNQFFSHDMSQGFPLLTTKRMSLRNVAVELEGFIKGITDKRWYQERKCTIWNEWSNPKSNDNNDLGPIYGYSWRRFGQQYGTVEGTGFGSIRYDNLNGLEKGYDQLKNIVDSLKNHPNDRRMVCSAWNPNQISMMALPPCHYSWGVTVYDNKLHMIVNIRSWDVLLGAPYNIASYALLLSLLGKISNFKLGNLSISALDAHLYTNQIEVAREQLLREPYQLPKLEIEDNIDIFTWEYHQFKLLDYNAHPPLAKVKVIV